MSSSHRAMSGIAPLLVCAGAVGLPRRPKGQLAGRAAGASVFI
jgi:hypothetical protein